MTKLIYGNDLVGFRPFDVAYLKCYLKTASMYIVPVLHTTIYRVPKNTQK